MPSRKRVTISDVAREAGVSPGTVSRVLNQRDGDIKISPATQQRVQTAIQHLGYQRNPFASALRTERTGIIGAITRDISAVFLSQVARELQQVAHSQGIELLIDHAEQDLETVDRQLDLMHSQWFDGLLLLGDLPGYQAVIGDLERYQKPFVSIACGLQVPPPFVNVDEEIGVQLALDYLKELGHRWIAFIGNHERAGVVTRLGIFEEYVQEHQLNWIEGYTQVVPITRRDAIASAKYLLNLPEPPTAIFCATDIQAFGAITGALQLGLKVPEQVSIIGFDDVSEAVDTFPALTTVRQPVRKMAEEAIRLLTTLIEDSPKEAPRDQVIVAPELIIRESCALPVLQD